MRGSIYYQTSQLTQLIFAEGAKKIERIDENNENYNKVSSYQSMDSYRRVWNNLFKYLKEIYEIKDCERIQPEHISAYLYHKTEDFPSEQYIQKICSAISKLEFALNKLSVLKQTNQKYDFSIKQTILDDCRDNNLLKNNYHNRAYKNPLKVIGQFKYLMHKLAARIELSGGARLEGCAFIKKDQLLGYEIDSVTKIKKGVIVTKEKGGKVGLVKIEPELYESLQHYIEDNGYFKIAKQQYYKDIRQACEKLKIASEATHGFRWNFAQRRLLEYTENGYYYEQALQAVSNEMKHNRASITMHYQG